MASPSLSAAATMATHHAPSSVVGTRINVGTRKQHTELNRLLVHRLPLALPPHQKKAGLFGRGILPFASLFLFFESEWDLFVQNAQQNPPADGSHDDLLRTWLVNLRPHGLARSARFEQDLKHLRTIMGSSIRITPELGSAWIDLMRARIRTQPHVLVAFAWVFYMACFAGGRWIRQQLATSGEDFWHDPAGGHEKPDLDLPGFSFLSFEGDEDGEDIKFDFKQRLVDGEHLLTSKEQQDVIDTAGQLFERCNGLVYQLDRMVLREQIASWTITIVPMLLLFAVYLAWRTSNAPLSYDPRSGNTTSTV